MKGTKQQKQPSTKERVKDIEVTLKNMQMALQMSQMMTKHLTEQFQTFHSDLGSTMGMLNDFQYRSLAMLELGNFNVDDVDAKAAEFKERDFTAASNKEDVDKGLINDDAGVIEENSIVILSSNTPDLEEDKGIFRSKFPMAECLTPELREGLLGAKVGDVVEATIQETRHLITIIGLRKEPEVEEAEIEEAVELGEEAKGGEKE